MVDQQYMLDEIVDIDGYNVEICKDGYGVYHAITHEAPIFNICDHDANKKDIIDIATHTIDMWQRFSEKKGYYNE